MSECPNCEALREEIADYMGHRTDNIAGKMWAARHLFSRFEDQLEDLIGEIESLGHDDYDQSLEIYGVPEHIRLDGKAQKLIRDAGFGKVYVNHGPKGDDRGRWETHYCFYSHGEPAPLPVRGWRRRYVADPTVSTTRVIAGPKENGYYEISYWPEDWGERAKADLASGYYRIVPDPLDPFASGIETEGGNEVPSRSDESPPAESGDAQEEPHNG